MVMPNKEADIPYGKVAREQIVDYTVVSVDANGKATQVSDPHGLKLDETLDKGNPKKVGYCDSPNKCGQAGVTPDNPFKDKMAVTSDAGPHTVTKRFKIDGRPAQIYDPASHKAYDYVKVDASVKKGFVFNYGNDPN
jgi:hypothetical protein